MNGYENSTITYSLSNVSKSFGVHTVLKNLCFEINGGDFVLLLGANGSGKSTLLRICAGLSRADSGDFRIGGVEVKKLQSSQIAHTGHDLMLYENLSLVENLALVRDLMSLDVDISGHLESWNLTSNARKRIKELSKGQQYRASLCRMFIQKPKYVFLDEPTSSLDESSIETLISNISNNLDKNGFIIIATHDVSRLRNSANRVVVLNDGKILKDSADNGTIDDVLEYYRNINR